MPASLDVIAVGYDINYFDISEEFHCHWFQRNIHRNIQPPHTHKHTNVMVRRWPTDKSDHFR